MAENKGNNKGHDNLIPLKKGQTANPNGRPKGQRNYKTIYLEALRRIGQANGKTEEEMEELIQEVGLKHAIKGHFHFWKDINDRIYGKTPDVAQISLTVEPNERIKKLAKKLNA